jgi:hypothetical protein
MALRPREAALLKEAVAKSFSNFAEVLSGAPERIRTITFASNRQQKASTRDMHTAGTASEETTGGYAFAGYTDAD